VTAGKLPGGIWRYLRNFLLDEGIGVEDLLEEPGEVCF